MNSPIRVLHVDDDPAFENFGHACYVGAEVVVDGKPFGTVCFFGPEPRQTATGSPPKGDFTITNRAGDGPVRADSRHLQHVRDTTVTTDR